LLTEYSYSRIKPPLGGGKSRFLGPKTLALPESFPPVSCHVESIMAPKLRLRGIEWVGDGGGVITGEPKRTAAPKPQPRAPSDLRLTADARTQSVD